MHSSRILFLLGCISELLTHWVSVVLEEGGHRPGVDTRRLLHRTLER